MIWGWRKFGGVAKSMAWGALAGAVTVTSCLTAGPPLPWIAGEDVATAPKEESLGGFSEGSMAAWNALVQPKMVKVYGAGGVRGIEGYQSGFLISASGHVATSWSSVLDVESTQVVTWDGKKWPATLVGTDPVSEIAVLKIDSEGLPFFSLESDLAVAPGMRVFAVSNLFGIAQGKEWCSIQRGVLMAKAPMEAKRGRFATAYRGDILILDTMTNNPGATGGAAIDAQGELLGMLGKELRDERSQTWINYALPRQVVSQAVKNILEGKTGSAPVEMPKAKSPHRLERLGMAMVPDILARTPAYIDQVAVDSLAAKTGLMADDLILSVNDQRIDGQATLRKILESLESADGFQMVVQRDGQILSMKIQP
jgi:serine protease Do